MHQKEKEVLENCNNMLKQILCTWKMNMHFRDEKVFVRYR